MKGLWFRWKIWKWSRGSQSKIKRKKKGKCVLLDLDLYRSRYQKEEIQAEVGIIRQGELALDKDFNKQFILILTKTNDQPPPTINLIFVN